MSSFDQRVWELTRRIPRGKVTTYALLAQALGSRAYRAVGNALHRNPYAPAVPCHRVVKGTGEIGGFAGGTEKKIAMLTKDGVPVEHGRVRDLAKHLFAFR